MYAIFKKHFDKTPTQYRNEYRDGSEL